MYRFGERESHSYVLGAWDTKEYAELRGVEEHKYRGGKYESEVVCCNTKNYEKEGRERMPKMTQPISEHSL